MTEQRIDHAGEARKLLDAVKPFRDQDLDIAMRSALVHATLALVDAQREANDIARAQARIALGQFRVGVNDLPHLRHLVVQPVGEYDIGPTPEIAAALGIETKETSE